ncbi:hypothetical protein MACH15_06130 [Maricaulis maris]|nr:hypothetical protein MACH15_06130 [Maricaulis maris]
MEAGKIPGGSQALPTEALAWLSKVLGTPVDLPDYAPACFANPHAASAIGSTAAPISDAFAFEALPCSERA